MKKAYTIGELAELAGVSTKTLRVYERKGLLLPERNVTNQYRMYTEDTVRKLEQIQLMKYLGFSLEQIVVFLSGHEGGDREEMLLTQKRMLEKKRAQLDSVIACVERAVTECREGIAESEAFLHTLGSIVKNQKADELVVRLGMHSDEPRGWSEFVFEQAGLTDYMRVLDAGAGYGNLWRYHLHRLPTGLQVICVDQHNTHADDFYEYVRKKETAGELSKEQISFVWEDLELRKSSEKYNCIFFNHVASFIQDRVSLYRRFRDSLCENGTVICTWGGLLINENAAAVLSDFLKDAAPLKAHRKKHETTIRQYESELREVFVSVERKAYVTTLHFATAEEYMEYLLQVCKPAEVELEQRRPEFVEYLSKLQTPEGGYEFVRDTYLYRCKREV
ncbi:MAG: MerR family transcriptional regulator [Lachnospiraceae bacterium]|nr:MerR family transcriptional regulator [Lachnospiraceae bacterium]